LNAEATEPEKETEESTAQPTGLAAALEKAAPVNEQERAKSQKRRV
jgi:U2 small nuclear ribonucleoprotein B''